MRSKNIVQRATKITIDEKEIILDYGEIKRIIEKKITYDQ